MSIRIGWLVVLRFYATLKAQVIWWSVTHMFPGFLTPVLTQVSFQSHRLLFSHAWAEVKGENTPERNFASTGSRTHNHKVISSTRLPLIHPVGHMSLEAPCAIFSRILMKSPLTTVATADRYSKLMRKRFVFAVRFENLIFLKRHQININFLTKVIKALKAWASKELVIDWLAVCFSRRFQHFYYIFASGAPIDAFLIKILWPLLYTFHSQTLPAFQHNYRRKNG